METKPMKSTPKSAAIDLTTPPVVSPPKPPLSAIHDAAQQARYLRQILEDNKLRIGCFLGAGCPLGVYDAMGKESVVLIPAVAELTLRVAAELGPAGKEAWDLLCGECKSPDCAGPTVEDILTELRTLANRRGSATVLGLTKKRLKELDIEISGLIVKEMTKSLPEYRSSYNRFASWIGGRQGIFPVEIFTPNYDLLFEQAFEQHPLPHFDGFVGSREPWFDLASIECDAIPGRWTRLWKLHGSINWEKIEDIVNGASLTRIVRVAREAEKDRVMIAPSHLKYDQSRRMPYLAMLDRVRAFFRGDADKNEEDSPRLEPPRIFRSLR
ncbi:MAG: SIR2 family protein [Syntrophales bacterium]